MTMLCSSENIMIVYQTQNRTVFHILKADHAKKSPNPTTQYAKCRMPQIPSCHTALCCKSAYFSGCFDPQSSVQPIDR